MSLVLSDQDYVLKEAVAAAKIPHGQKVRVRVPDVQVAGSRRHPVLKFCSVSRVELLYTIPPDVPGMKVVELNRLDLVVEDTNRLTRKWYGFHDAIGVMEINGRIRLEVEQLVPCGAV